MGNCCRGNSTNATEPGIEQSENVEHYKFDYIKDKTLSKHLIVLCLDISPTAESSRLKTLLRGSVSEFASFNGERRLLDQIASTPKYTYLIIVIGKVKQTTLQELVDASNVTAIYLCLGIPRTDGIPQSQKIKGVYEHIVGLRKAIDADLSL